MECFGNWNEGKKENKKNENNQSK